MALLRQERKSAMNHALQRMTALLLAGVLAGSGMTAAALATPEQAATPEAAAPVLPPEVPAATPEQTEPAAAVPDAAVPDAAAAPRAAGQVVEGTVSPIGTTINLFDYWITTRDAPDNTNPPDLDQGINAGKALIFTANPGRGGSINNYTGSANPRTGMVLPTLQEGYPQLTASGQSLNYLFNPALPNAGKASYPNVRDLLQIDEDGYYYYNCTQDFAQFDEASNTFTLYTPPGVLTAGSAPLLGQFFPFNNYEQVKGVNARNPAINHYFGMTMTTRFVQQPYGTVDGTAGGTPVTYDFSGDDDVWVFIDNVLVGDLGGIHDAASLSINFQTGQILVNGAPDGTLRSKFQAANVPWTNGSADTFADDTYHTLKFFYLERGNVDSNMELKFNLVSIPQSDLIKVDQTGAAVPGARFNLYYAGDDYTYNPQDLIATGTTGPDGTFVFQNPDGTLLSLNNLKNEYGGPGRTGKFVLVEESVPAGYRAPGPIDLYFPADYPQLATLLSANPWDTGAYASPTVTVTLPDTVEDLQGQQYPADSGTYFAVVLKRQSAGGDGSSTQSAWYPVSGDPIEGWQVADSTNLAAVLAAARANPYLFVLDSSGAYKDTLENLPGDILTYYYVLASNGKLTADNAQYTVGFYRTSAASLADATPENTVRLNDGASINGQNFNREFAVRLYVPDIKNYLFVQKIAEDGYTPLSGAGFALYKASDVTDGAVNPGAQPFDTVTTRNQSQNQGDVITLGGAGVFPNTQAVLPAGTYYLKELQAPAGYAPSDDLTEVIVDNTDVYANAGTADDDITVLRGVGKIVRSMLQFAVPDDINATLTDIQAALYTAPSYTPGTGNDWAVWTASGQTPLALSYYQNNQILEYGPTTPGDPVYFAVQSGWSRLRITQNYAAGTDQALKINLGDQNVSNVFARSTIVQVRNQSTRLVLQKQVTGALGEVTRPFAFTIALQDAAGTPLTGGYGGLTFSAQGTAETALTDGGEITLRGLPDGTVCTVYEEPVPDYETTVRVNGGTAQPGPSVQVTTAPGLTTILYINRSTLVPPSPTPAPSGTPSPAPSGCPQGTATPAATTRPGDGASVSPAPAATAIPAPSVIPPTGDAFPLWGLLLLTAASAGLFLLLRRLHR